MCVIQSGLLEQIGNLFSSLQFVTGFFSLAAVPIFAIVAVKFIQARVTIKALERKEKGINDVIDSLNQRRKREIERLPDEMKFEYLMEELRGDRNNYRIFLLLVGVLAILFCTVWIISIVIKIPDGGGDKPKTMTTADLGTRLEVESREKKIAIIKELGNRLLQGRDGRDVIAILSNSLQHETDLPLRKQALAVLLYAMGDDANGREALRRVAERYFILTDNAEEERSIIEDGFKQLWLNNNDLFFNILKDENENQQLYYALARLLRKLSVQFPGINARVTSFIQDTHNSQSARDALQAEFPHIGG